MPYLYSGGVQPYSRLSIGRRLRSLCTGAVLKESKSLPPIVNGRLVSPLPMIEKVPVIKTISKPSIWPAMGEEWGGKLTGILQIVRLRKILQRWQSITRGPREDQAAGRASGGIPPAVDKRLKGAQVQCDSDEDGCMSPELPSDVPKGYIPVYVGPEQRRFVIPTSYLSLPVFKVLLEKAEEEFGFDLKGALTFPCPIETFKYILQCMERHRKGLIDDEGNPTGLEE